MTPPEVHLYTASPEPPKEPHATIVVRVGLAPATRVPLTVGELDGLARDLGRARRALFPQFIIRNGHKGIEGGAYFGGYRGFGANRDERWYSDQLGAKKYDNKKEADKDAKELGNCRVVRLVPKRGT